MQSHHAALLLILAAPQVGAAQAPLAERSAWYPFEPATGIGESLGVTPWPAYAFRATTGPGKVGASLAMRGEGANGLLLPNPAGFFGPEARAGTIALWLRPDFDPKQEPGQRVIIDFSRESGNTLIDGYETLLITEKDRLAAAAAITERLYVPSPLTKGHWTHLLLTWNSEVGSALYVNGEKAAERRGRFAPTPLSDWPGRVGAHTPWGGYPFSGALDELRLLDRMVTDAEAGRLAQPSSPPPPLKVESPSGDALRVANASTEEVTVWLRTWLPEQAAGEALWGGLPVPENELGVRPLYIGGASGPVLRDGEPQRLAPGQAATLRPPVREDYLRWVRFGVMAGEGPDAREVARRDLDGLVVTASPTVLFTKRPSAVNLTVENRLGRAYAGALSGTVDRTLGSRVAAIARRNATLKPGEKTTLDVGLAGTAPGSYRLRLQATTAAGTAAPLREVTVPVLEDTSYRTVFGAGAAYVSNPPSPDLLARMARDGVKVVRRSGGSWLREETEVLPYGSKMWYGPAFSANSICTSPSVVRQTEELGRSLGACLREKPAVLNQVMLGEGLTRTPCYCDDCTRDFRRYLRSRHPTLQQLNAAWGSSYGSFDEIDQLGSPRDVSAAAEQMALMQRRLPENHAQRWRELFRRDRPRAIEWRRWHDGVLVDWYARFAAAFRQTNQGRTALSEQPCWPNFKHHVLFRLGETADLGGMDLYLPGEGPTTLGYAAELFLNFDLNASLFQGKPLWLHELYVQDNSPPLLPEAQGWFLVGRGYSMLTYFTYDYYKEGIRSNLPLIFGMFDPEGKPYPCYESFARFSRQAQEFHRRYDVFSLRREQPRVALFLGDDLSLANELETGGETWEAAGVHGHNGAYWLTERNGDPVDFINDAGFARLTGKRVLIVPWTHVIRAASLERILSFARAGGAVILDGPVGLYDDCYRPYSPLPGGPTLRELGVAFKEYRDEPNELTLLRSDFFPPVKADITKVKTRGVPVGVTVSGGEVLATDAHGSPALVRRKLGRGEVFWFLTSLGREQLSRRPDEPALTLWNQVLRTACREMSRHTVIEPDPAAGGALVDLSVRVRRGNEAFLFLVSFFDAAEVDLSLRLPPATYEATDALTGQRLDIRAGGTQGLQVPAIRLPAYGTKVVRLVCRDKTPFTSW